MWNLLTWIPLRSLKVSELTTMVVKSKYKMRAVQQPFKILWQTTTNALICLPSFEQAKRTVGLQSSLF
jgi:hypothetical protein